MTETPHTLSTSFFHRPVAMTLHFEGLLIAIAALVAFAQTGGSWLLFAVLILAPDLLMLGYLAGNRIGALCYNAGHSYGGPVVLGLMAFGTGSALGQHLALIWIAHIGCDRALGYGLKYAAGFKHTHLGRV